MVRVVLGLGNPGTRYERTRHNLGFWVCDLLARRHSRGGCRFEPDPERRVWATTVDLGGRTAVLAKPRTYMNRSGAAAIALCRRHEISPQELLVVYDDADLALGRIRLRGSGRAGGHRGVRSLIDALRTEEFPRVRLGVRGAGRDGAELADYVLEEFEADEREAAEALVELGADAVEAVFARGFDEAMNLFNGRSVTAGFQDEEADPGKPKDPGT